MTATAHHPTPRPDDPGGGPLGPEDSDAGPEGQPYPDPDEYADEEPHSPQTGEDE